MKLDVAVLSRQGGRSRNEDACGYWTSDAGCCWVVSDGAGGHGGGDVAAQTAVSTIVREFAAGPAVSAEAIATLIRGANRALLVKQRTRQELRDMRATVAVLMIDRTRECVLWGTIGDTRVYCFRGGSMHFQTRDHSVMQSLIEAGYGDPASLRNHPRRGVLLHALGADEPLPPPVTDSAMSLRDRDAFLLCTDGLWEAVGEAAMEEALVAAGSAAEWLAALEAELLRSVKPRHDNYSAIAVYVDQLEDATRFDTI